MSPQSAGPAGTESAPLRVLIVHAAYRQRGGEDVVVQAEAELLRQHGHDVDLFMRRNEELKALPAWQQATQTMWSRASHAALTRELARGRPDIVHVHNTFAALSPSIYSACARAGVPVVQTLHNFRLACPQAMFLRDGKVCEDCVGHVPWRAVRHACYEGSRAQSAVLAGMLTLHRALGTWQHQVATYIALNEFCRAKFIAAGLPASKLVVKPNFADLPAPAPQARAGFLFVGRLSVEKGVACLAEAMKRCSAPLRVVGHGDEAARLAGLAHVVQLGACERGAVFAEMQRARALVLPSIWYENFPMVMVEAYANGLPVIASRLGAMAELVEHGHTGLLVPPGDAAALAETLSWADAHPSEMQAMGERARAIYEERYSADVNHRLLSDIYRRAIAAQPPVSR